jgi:hypothetical protein
MFKQCRCFEENSTALNKHCNGSVENVLVDRIVHSCYLVTASVQLCWWNELSTVVTARVHLCSWTVLFTVVTARVQLCSWTVGSTVVTLLLPGCSCVRGPYCLQLLPCYGPGAVVLVDRIVQNCPQL